MIARVTLEIALRKEFDYLIPPELDGPGGRGQPGAGAVWRAQGARAASRRSPRNPAQARLKPIVKVIGAQTLVTPKVLKLARWIGGILLLPAGDRVEKRFAGGRPQRSRRAGASGCMCACCRRAGRISETAQAAAGGLEHHRGTPRDAAAGIAGAGRKPRRPPCGAWRTGLVDDRRGNFRARSLRARGRFWPSQPLALNPAAGARRWRRSWKP